MRRSGLSKRKRITEGAPVSAEASVWHSTPIEEINVNPDGIESENVISDGEQPTPIKRPALAGLVNRPLNVVGVERLQTPCLTPIIKSASATPSPIIISAPTGHSVFTSVLQRHGFIIGQHRNHLHYDCMQFRKKMFEWIKQDSQAKHRVESEYEKFIKDMTAYFSKKENLRQAMTITLIKEEDTQPPLLHCLLGVENLQPQVVKAIIPILTDASFSSVPDDVSLAESILKQFMYLPDITDGSALLTSLLDILENGMSPVQKHLIHAIPIILPPKYHTEIVDKLIPIFENFQQLLSTFVDSFSTLHVDEHVSEKLRDATLEKMFQAPISDLPAFFSFLFQTKSLPAMENAISAIRENLVIRPAKKDSKHEAYLVQIIDKLRFWVSFKHDIDIVALWTKQVKDDCALGEEMKAIDLVVLLLIAESYVNNTTALYMLFGNKRLTLEMLTELIENCKPVVFQLFNTISNICQSVMRDKIVKLFPVVSDILVLMFRNLSPFEGQVIAFNLSTIIVSSNSEFCQDAALKIFSDIAAEEPKKLQMFTSSLMGILEHKVRLTNTQIRVLMNVLAAIAYIPGSHEANPFRSEFSILLRKQLSHHELSMRCYGVMGALATVKQLATINPEEEEIKNLLNLTWTFVERDKDACRIFFDEFSDCVGSIPMYECVNYRDLLKNKFESTWTAEDTTDNPVPTIGRGGLQMEITFDANKEVITDKLILVFEEKPLQLSPIVLPAHLRVITALENRVENNKLEGIDVILGLPICFPSISTYYEQDNLKGLDHGKKYHLGQYLVMAINFFRESVSSFADETITELRIKVWLRLSNIVFLQKILVKQFNHYPSLPKAYTSDKSVAEPSSAFGPVAGPSSAITNEGKKRKPVKKPRKKKTVTKKKKKKNDSENESDQESDIDIDIENDLNDNMEGETKGVKADDLVNQIQPKVLFPHLRRLDMKVFSLLKFPLSLDPVNIDFGEILHNIATEASANVLASVEMLTPETLTFLLAELNWQARDNANKFDILEVEDLLNSILCHLETIIAAYEDVGDGCLEENKQKSAEACFRLLINTLTVYLDAVTTFQGDRDSLIKKNITIIAARTVSGAVTAIEDLPSKDLAEHVAKYLENIAEFVIEASTAVDHMKLLKNMYDLLEDKDAITSSVDVVVKLYLSREWKLPSAQITYFLKSWMSMASNPIQVIHSVASSLIPPECAEGAPIPCTDFYKTCTKNNFQTWFSLMVSGLSQHVFKYGRKKGDYEQSMTLWSEAMDVLKILVLVAQKTQKKIILAPLLKNTRIFLEAFIVGGSSMLPELWKRNPERAHSFVRDLQHPTRRIQYVCEHSKVSKDQLMVRYVPMVKRTLERLVFRIREILSMHGVSSAFWMGSLKHRNLDGDVMNSQPFTNDEDSNDGTLFDSESEDDGTIDINISKKAVDGSRKTASIISDDSDDDSGTVDNLEDAVSDSNILSDSSD